jgi:hypothetical protein
MDHDFAAMLQLLLAVAIAEEPVVASAVEPTRQNVEQESPTELVCREGYGFLLIVVAIVSPLEFHLAVSAAVAGAGKSRETSSAESGCTGLAGPGPDGWCLTALSHAPQMATIVSNAGPKYLRENSSERFMISEYHMR